MPPDPPSSPQFSRLPRSYHPPIGAPLIHTWPLGAPLLRIPQLRHCYAVVLMNVLAIIHVVMRQCRIDGAVGLEFGPGTVTDHSCELHAIHLWVISF